MKTKNMKTTTMTTMMMITAAALIGTIGIGAQSAYAETIDFEGYTETPLTTVGVDSTTSQDVTFSIEGGVDLCTSRDGSIIEPGDPRYGYLGTGPDAIGVSTVQLTNNIAHNTNVDGWDACDYVIDFAFPVSNLSLDFLDAGEGTIDGDILLEVFSDHAQTTSVGSVAVDVDSVANNALVNLSIPNPTGDILSARLSDASDDAGSAIDNVTFDNKFTKVSNCDGKVFIKKHTGTQDCSFTIYPGIGDSNDMIHDTIPAEWGVLSAKTAEDSDCFVESANKGKKADKSATHIWCLVDEGPITVDVTTRESPGKGHTKNGGPEAWKPTFCGILTLNDGAQRVDADENLLDTTNSLTLLVSEGGHSFLDCDDDGLTDLEEFTGSENTDFGNEPTDPANPDSDGDGLLDGQETSGSENNDFGNEATNPNEDDTDGDGLSDYDEINIFTSDPNTSNMIILDTTLVGSPGGSGYEFVHHRSTGTEYGTGDLTCDPLTGSVFVLDNGYIRVIATSLFRDDCTVPTPTHDFVDATLHCDEGDKGPTSSVPLSTNGGASPEGDFDLTDDLGAIGTCTNATVFVESTDNDRHLAKSQ